MIKFMRSAVLYIYFLKKETDVLLCMQFILFLLFQNENADPRKKNRHAYYKCLLAECGQVVQGKQKMVNHIRAVHRKSSFSCNLEGCGWEGRNRAAFMKHTSSSSVHL